MPLTVIRRMDCVLEPTKAKVLVVHRKFGDRAPLLRAAAGNDYAENGFYNTSPLIRRFSELSNETAGEHFTPREVIRLMVDPLFTDGDDLRKPGIAQTLFDPAYGTGGMLSVAEERLRELNPDATLETSGQELNAETYAICRSDMMVKAREVVRGSFGG